MPRRDPDHYEPRRDNAKATPKDDRPKFGPPRPDLDRGMRGHGLTGEAGAYGPRSDMMEYGGFGPAAYDRHRNYYEGFQSSENHDAPKPVKRDDDAIPEETDESDSDTTRPYGHER
jgi:hypothetical protein